MNADAVANPVRGEAYILVGGRARVLRPTFASLVAAEEQLGPLYALVDRAGDGRLRLSEVAALFWHCLADRGEVTQDEVGEAVMTMGLAATAGPLRTLLSQILQGRA